MLLSLIWRLLGWRAAGRHLCVCAVLCCAGPACAGSLVQGRTLSCGHLVSTIPFPASSPLFLFSLSFPPSAQLFSLLIFSHWHRDAWLFLVYSSFLNRYLTPNLIFLASLPAISPRSRRHRQLVPAPPPTLIIAKTSPRVNSTASFFAHDNRAAHSSRLRK